MIISVIPYGIGCFFVIVVSGKQAIWHTISNLNYDFSLFAGLSDTSVGKHHGNFVQWTWFTHGARTWSHSLDITDQHRRLGLSKSFHNIKSRFFFKFLIDFRVQCLACRRYILQRRKVIFFQLQMNHNTICRRWCTECCNFIFFDHLQNLFRIKIVKIIRKNRCFADPLSV